MRSPHHTSPHRGGFNIRIIIVIFRFPPYGGGVGGEALRGLNNEKRDYSLSIGGLFLSLQLIMIKPNEEERNYYTAFVVCHVLLVGNGGGHGA